MAFTILRSCYLTQIGERIPTVVPRGGVAGLRLQPRWVLIVEFSQASFVQVRGSGDVL
jgi:hypothetical protein